MSSQRAAGTGRTRGSWTPRLVGLGAAVLLALAGAVAYIVAAPAHASRGPQALPTRVQSVQTVGLVARLGVHEVARMLTYADGSLLFGDLPSASLAQGDPQWTADAMVGGTYVFIYVPDGECLATASRRPGAVLTLSRCSLGPDQRWQRVSDVSEPDGRQYTQLRSLASHRCLAADTTADPALEAGGRPAAPATLVPCALPPPLRQLISFWWAA